MNSDGCEQDCSNMPGGYYCSCVSGYSMNSDLHTCSGITSTHTSTHHCQCMNNDVHTSISITRRKQVLCVCFSATISTVKNQNKFYNYCVWSYVVIDVDECAGGSDGCHQICSNHDGGFLCSCEKGYLLSDDMKTCTCTLHHLPPKYVARYYTQRRD